MKIHYRNFQILLPACILLLGCGQNSADKTGDVPVIEIVQNLGKYQAVPLSRFVTELEYIPLETSYDCFMPDDFYYPIVTPTHIFIRGFRFCYAFDRNGRFLGQIGSVGQGPGEYSYLTDWTIDENSQSLYLEAFRTLLEYSWDGVFRRSIRLPEHKYNFTSSNNFFVRDSLFIGHFRNHKGDLPHNFVLFDQSSEVVKSFDNHVQFKPKRERTNWTNSAMTPYRIGEHIYVKELGNDTLFRLNGQNEIVPQFVFDIGKYTSTIERREYAPPRNELWKSFPGGEIQLPLQVMIGTQNHIFFDLRARDLSGKYSFPQKRKMPTAAPSNSEFINFQPTRISIDAHTVLGIYDTANGTTQLLDTDPVTQMMGFINDLDGGLSFCPKYYTSDNELVDAWRAEDMKDYLTEAYFAAHEIKNPEAHQKLKELLENVTEFDNPVIVIAKLKPDL